MTIDLWDFRASSTEGTKPDSAARRCLKGDRPDETCFVWRLGALSRTRPKGKVLRDAEVMLLERGSLRSATSDSIMHVRRDRIELVLHTCSLHEPPIVLTTNAS